MDLQVRMENILRETEGSLIDDTRAPATCAYGSNTAVNEYTTVGGVAVAHDPAGNLTGDHRGYSYVYDYENRIIEVRKSAGTLLVAAYAYDALGRRIEMAAYDNSQSPVTSKTTRYYYDGQRAVLQSETTADGLEERALVYGNYIDEVLVMRRKLTTGSTVDFFFGHDHLYSPVVRYNMVGGVAERYEYDAYGAVQVMNSSYVAINESTVRNSITFTGRELDVLDNGSLKIMYYRARYYDPQTGRFMQRDPKDYIDSMCLYEYVCSKPLTQFDPYGDRSQPGNGDNGIVCNKIRSIVDRIENLPEGSGARIDAINELYSLLSKGGLKYPLAAGAMQHWLSGTNEDYTLSKSDLTKDSGIAALIDSVLKNGKPGCESEGSKAASQQVTPSNKDLYYATGTFTLNAEMTWTDDCSSSCERKVEIRWWMRDPYDWHKGFDANVCGIAIQDSWALELQAAKNLQTFDVVADWTDKIGCRECKEEPKG
jgi:RHS repeat-associated protein